MHFLDFFAKRRDAGAPLVLVTVVETAGTTYSKPGHRMLIDAQGQYFGLISGGCLEGDLVEHAQKVFVDGQSRIVTYDLRDDDESLWGLGIGCGGMIKLLLQRSTAAQAYEPLATIAASLLGEGPLDLILVVSSEHPKLPLGASLIRAADGSNALLMASDASAAKLLGALADTVASGPIDGHAVKCLRQILLPIPRILVLGTGPDAVPVISGCQALGWRVAVGDHRPAYLDRPEFDAAQRHLLADEDAVRALLSTTRYAAAIVMSHNLRADERYLRALASSGIVYVGLLGPRHRRGKLMEKLEPAAAARLATRLHSPVGLDIGADSPASIALSILAEIHSALHPRPTNIPNRV